jgi:hypothetical protein
MAVSRALQQAISAHTENKSDVNEGSNQSAWSYVVDKLIDKPGQTMLSLCFGRPAHLSPRSIEATLYALAKKGILERNGKGQTALWRVSKSGLDNVKASWSHQGLPGAGQGQRGQRSDSKGFAGVARLEPEQRAPLSPLKGKPVELHEDAPVIKPGGHFTPVTPPKEGPSPEAIKAAEASYVGPHVIVDWGGTARKLPLAVAKSLHKQLKEFFE